MSRLPWRALFNPSLKEEAWRREGVKQEGEDIRLALRKD